MGEWKYINMDINDFLQHNVSLPCFCVNLCLYPSCLWHRCASEVSEKVPECGLNLDLVQFWSSWWHFTLLLAKSHTSRAPSRSSLIGAHVRCIITLWYAPLRSTSHGDSKISLLWRGKNNNNGKKAPWETQWGERIKSRALQTECTPV